MDLRTYLFEKRLTMSQFAKTTGYSRVHISGVKEGRIKATDRFKKILLLATDGKVNEWPNGKSDECLEKTP